MESNLTNSQMTTDAIAQINEERERSARSQVRDYLQGILAQQKQIEVLRATIHRHEEEIIKIRTCLASVTFEPVTATELLGK